MTASTDPVLTTRHATLSDLATLLQDQHGAALDVVAPAGQIRATGGFLRIEGTGEPVLTSDGVDTPAGMFRPTASCDAQVADKLGIPVAYLRRTREAHVDLYDTNVNTWLADDPTRRFLVRTLRGGSDRPGVARALLSEKYRFTDNLDVLMSVLAGIKTSGAQVSIASADLSEQRMYVAIRSADIAVHAPRLLAGYTSPFTGARGADNPVVFAGMVVSNSETGHGSFSITPRIVAQVCDNGMTITRDAVREVHLGGRLDEGVIAWSASTQQAALDLVTAKARDAVTTFLDADYVARAVDRIERDAGVPIGDVTATIEYVGKQLRFTTEQQQTILAHFIDGGQRTSGGVMHAVTSTAQTLHDPDDAYELERNGLRAMTLAAGFQH